MPVKLFQYNMYNDFRHKRALFLDLSQNLDIAKIKSYQQLYRVVETRMLSEYLNKPVDIVPYQHWNRRLFDKYDELILYQSDETYRKSRYFDNVKEVIRKASWKMSRYGEHPIFHKDKELYPVLQASEENIYYGNFLDFLESQPNRVFGDFDCLNLYFPRSYITPSVSWTFNCPRVYDSVTVFFGTFDYPVLENGYTSLDNLAKRLMTIRSKRRDFVLPIKMSFEDKLLPYLKQKITNLGFNLMEFKPKFNTSSPYKNSIWNYETNNFSKKRIVTIKA